MFAFISFAFALRLSDLRDLCCLLASTDFAVMPKQRQVQQSNVMVGHSLRLNAAIRV